MTSKTGTDASAKPTPGPWEACNTGWGDSRSIYGGDDGDTQIVDGRYTRGGELCEINARFMVAACNSYQKHAADPVAAAEADWVGELLGVATMLQQELDARNCICSRSLEHRCRDALRRSREPKP